MFIFLSYLFNYNVLRISNHALLTNAKAFSYSCSFVMTILDCLLFLLTFYCYYSCIACIGGMAGSSRSAQVVISTLPLSLALGDHAALIVGTVKTAVYYLLFITIRTVVFTDGKLPHNRTILATSSIHEL